MLDKGNIEEEGEYLSGHNLVLSLIAVNLVVFLSALDQTIVSTAVPKITNEFNSFSDVGWYASAYLLTSTAFQPLFGRLYQMFSVKYIFFIAFVIFEIGSLICGVAQSSSMLIVGRAIAGLGLAGGYSGAMIIVNLVVPKAKRPTLTSLMGATYGVGGTIGPLLGGAFTSHASWRWCFYINLVFFAIVAPAVIIWLKVPEHKHEQKTIGQRLRTIDWLGSALILCSLICILLVLQWGGVKYAWNDSKIIGLIIGFFVIAAAFIVDQWYRGDDATIPFRLFKNRTVAFGTIVSFGIAAAYFSELYFLPIYFQTVRGSSALRSGVQTLPFIVAVIISITATGIVVEKTGVYVPYLIAGSALTSLGGGMLYFLEPNSSQALWCGLQFLSGIGPGMTWMLPFIASTAALPVEEIEIGSAIVIFFQTLGGTIFVSVAQAIFQNDFVKGIERIPGASVEEVIGHGVSAFRDFTPEALLPSVIEAANDSLKKDWLLVTALGAFAFVGVFGMELNRRITPGTQVAMA